MVMTDTMTLVTTKFTKTVSILVLLTTITHFSLTHQCLVVQRPSLPVLLLLPVLIVAGLTTVVSLSIVRCTALLLTVMIVAGMTTVVSLSVVTAIRVATVVSLTSMRCTSLLLSVSP
jgi:hypothetical protein